MSRDVCTFVGCIVPSELSKELSCVRISYYLITCVQKSMFKVLENPISDRQEKAATESSHLKWLVPETS